MHAPQIKIPAMYMRGGTSKGVFFKLDDLPPEAQTPGAARDALMQRIIGSPDPYGKHTDGMGGATSSTSKVVIVSKSNDDEHDVNYLFGQVSIDKAFVDWSGNCGNLSSAVAPFAIHSGLVSVEDSSVKSLEVRIWQENISKTIIAKVPLANGRVQEAGDFELDGVTFPAAEIQLQFMHPAAAVFPTGNLIDTLVIPELGTFDATLINAGIATIFIKANALGYSGTELQSDINSDAQALARFETIRAYGAQAMGLITQLDEAKTRQHTPKIAMVAPPESYQSSSGALIEKQQIDLNVRAMSMGQLHHAMMGTAAVAISIATAIPGTLVNLAAGGGERNSVRFGHPSGTLKVGGQAEWKDDQWNAVKALMSRSARVLMNGHIWVPFDG